MISQTSFVPHQKLIFGFQVSLEVLLKEQNGPWLNLKPTFVSVTAIPNFCFWCDTIQLHQNYLPVVSTRDWNSISALDSATTNRWLLRLWVDMFRFGWVCFFVCLFFCFVFCFCLFYFALQNRRVGTFWATGASFLSGQRWRHFEICAALGTRMFKPQNRGVFCHVTHDEMAFRRLFPASGGPFFFVFFFAIWNRCSNETKTFHRVYVTEF